MTDNGNDEEAVVRPELHGQDGTVELNVDPSEEEADEAAKREAAAAAAAAAKQADAEQQTDGDAAADPADADNQGLEGEQDEENEDGKPKKPLWDWGKRREGCGLCGARGCTVVCEKCGQVRYCCKDHRRTHWKIHRRICSPCVDPYKKQNLEQTVAELRKEASNGSAEAQYKLGHAAIHGKYGLKQNYRLAQFSLEMAAAQEHAPAEHALGLLYLHGEGVEQHFSAAASWFRKAAARDHPGAMVSLGLMWMEGRIVDDEEGKTVEDVDAKAVALFEKAAAEPLNSAHAQYNLGFLTLKGRGTPKSAPKALELFERAAAQGHAAAQHALDLNHARRHPRQPRAR